MKIVFYIFAVLTDSDQQQTIKMIQEQPEEGYSTKTEAEVAIVKLLSEDTVYAKENSNMFIMNVYRKR